MRLIEVRQAIVEAKRFLRTADLAHQRFIKEAQESDIDAEHVYFTSKETAACKRASMDLTRALADLRRGYK